MRVRKLHECRNCGGLVATKQTTCPYCEATDAGTKTVADLDTGDPVEVPKSLYRPIEVSPADD